MGDTLELFRPLCNGSVRVESRTEKLTGDTGFLLLREALGRTALIKPLAAHLDPRDPRRVTHSLPSHVACQCGDDCPGLPSSTVEPHFWPFLRVQV